MADRDEGPGGPAGRVLVLAPVGRNAEVLCRLLAGDGVAAEACRDVGELLARLREGAGAVLLTDEALDGPSWGALAEALAGQPPWSDLPVLLLDAGVRADAPRAGGHLSVLPRPARALAVLTAVRSALRARLRQYEVRDLLARLREARDGLEERVRERTAELVRSQERALQAERLAAIGQTVTAVAHEGRNALQRAAANLERLGWKLEGRPEEQELAGRARQGLDDLEHLFDDLRGFAAPVRLDYKRCDLSEVWREAWARVAARHPRPGAGLEEEGGAADPACDADPFRLGQVFTNLLSNALEACPDPVRVTVSCRDALLADRPALRVCVRDNGPGFPQEQRRRAFEPFLTTKPTGTGLGLAITKRIVEAHGGQIALGEGPGAEVVITLPRRKA